MSKAKKILLFLFAINICYAGTVTDLIDYREYRDFAENRGKYKVGNTNIVVTRKDGVTKTIEVPMPDFSSTDSLAIGTLIDPNYAVGVKHNAVMTSVKYGYAGGHEYKFVDRNDHPTNGVDRYVPRLNKVVTDVAPTTVGTVTQNYKDTYEIYMRVGSGHQYIMDSTTGEREDLANAYRYLTGGTIDKDFLGDNLIAWDRGPNFNGSAVDKNILPIHLDPGDSGSPLWGYNKNTQQWELIAFGVAGSDISSYYVAVEPGFYEEEIRKDTMPDVKNSDENEIIVWNGINDKQGTGTIQQGNNIWKYDGLKSGSMLSAASNDELNFAKHITFDGAGGTIQLQDHINMGAGKLTFKNDYTMEGKDDDISWVGAGIDIAKDKTVTWKVKGQEGDDLHKIGEGTLLVQGTGINKGGLNVGAGTVFLDQQADSNGEKQAFSNIDIVSGRATVVLGDANQIDTDKIRFMFRGGKLDVNGNDLTFGKIVAYDDGAQIINKSENKATLNLDATKNLDKKDISRSTLYKGHFGEKGNEVGDKMDLNIYGTVDYAEYYEKSYAISGGINIDGDINYSSKGLNLVFQGVRDLHADEDPSEAPGKGEYYMSKFKFNNLYIRDRQENEFYHHGFIGGIYSDIEGDIIIEDSSSAVLGYVDDKWIVETEYGPNETNKTLVVYDSKDQKSMNDSIGQIGLTDENVSDEIKEGTTIYKGNVKITDKGTLDVGATYFTGGIEALNSGSVSMTNTKIEAVLNIGKDVISSVKNTIGKFKDSTINNNFEIKKESELLFENLTLGATGKLDIANSLVQVDNSQNIEGEILVAEEGIFIGNQSTINKVTATNGTIQLEDSKVTQDLVVKDKSEALLINSNLVKVDVTNNSIIKAEDTTIEKIDVTSESAIDFTGGKIDSLFAKESSLTLLDGTTVNNLDITSATEDKGVLISKNNNIDTLLGNNSHIELNNTDIDTKLDLKNKSEGIVENSNLSNVVLDDSILVSYGTKYIGDTTIKNKGILSATNSELAMVKSDNATVTTQGGKVSNIEVLNDSIFDSIGTTIENINIDNSKVISDSSVFNKDIVAKNNSNLDLNNSYILGNINLDNSEITLNNVNYMGGSSLEFLSVDLETPDNIITLSNNSSLTGIGSNIVGNIKFTESNINLNDSNLTGTLNGNGKVELENSSWYITDDSNISEFVTTKGDIKFISKSENEFYELNLDNISGDSKLTFNANFGTGESDKLVIGQDILGSFETEIDIDSVGTSVELDKKITLVLGKTEVIDKIKVTNTTVDLGLVQGKVEISNGELGLKPTTPTKPEEPEEPTTPDQPTEDGENGSIDVETPSEINKDTAGSTTTTMLNEYAARVEAIKNQNNLFKSEINFTQDEGVNYIGNVQHGRYETDKFREYSQTIINNGFIYKTNDVVNNDWSLSKGIGFSYGKSIIDYEGDYTGRIDNYGVYGYLQFINKAGYYIAPNIGLRYNENKINSEKFYTTSQNIGVKLGYQKELENNLKLTFETGIDMYHISRSDYNLDFKNSKYSGNMDGKYFVEVKPEVKVSKELELGNNKTSLYAGVGLEYNKYVFGGEPVVNIVEDTYQVETAMIDKGASIKAGVENSYKNVDVTLEAEYFTGKYNNEKIKGNIKIKYRF